METPTPKQLVDATGISPSYASMILSESADHARSRTPPLTLAGKIFRETGWKHPSVADLTNDALLELAARHDREKREAA